MKQEAGGGGLWSSFRSGYQSILFLLLHQPEKCNFTRPFFFYYCICYIMISKNSTGNSETDLRSISNYNSILPNQTPSRWKLRSFSQPSYNHIPQYLISRCPSQTSQLKHVTQLQLKDTLLQLKPSFFWYVSLLFINRISIWISSIPPHTICNSISQRHKLGKHTYRVSRRHKGTHLDFWYSGMKELMVGSPCRVS